MPVDKFALKLNRWDIIEQQFSRRLVEAAAIISDDTASVVKRMGLILYRLAMILTISRIADSNALKNVLVYNDKDFNTALRMSEVLLKHTLTQFEMMPKKGVLSAEKGFRKLYRLLPIGRFQAKDAVKLGLEAGMSERSVASYLKTLVEKNLLVELDGWGFYEKK